MGIKSLDAMIEGRITIPVWVFLRAADFISEVQNRGGVPPAIATFHSRRATRR